MEVVPDTVKRERYGGIIGTVRAASQMPVSRGAVAAAFGNADLADRLLTDPPCIEITVEFDRDPASFSGLRWTTSHGPEMKISPGTTTVGRVTLERRAPITYVLPYLRSASGI
jgi:HlyD family secretion protein